MGPDQRVSWVGKRPEGPAVFEERTWRAVCELQPVRPGSCQDELLEFSLVREADGVRTFALLYVFDHDYASQYDKTESWTARVEEAADGAVTVHDFRKG